MIEQLANPNCWVIDKAMFQGIADYTETIQPAKKIILKYQPGGQLQEETPTPEEEPDGSLKRTMKLVKKVLKDDDKAALYTEEELMYMRRQPMLWKSNDSTQTTQETQQVWLCQT